MIGLLSKEEQKNKIKKGIWESFLTSGLFILFAVVLLFKEEDILSTLILAIGMLGIVFGVLYFPLYFRIPKEMRIYSNDLMKGMVFVLFGGIAILKNDLLVDMVTIVIGAYLIYKNANRIQICLNLDEGVNYYWKYIACFSVVSIFLGILILLNPFSNIPFTMVLSVCVLVSESIHIFQNIAMLIGLRRVYESDKEAE